MTPVLIKSDTGRWGRAWTEVFSHVCVSVPAAARSPLPVWRLPADRRHDGRAPAGGGRAPGHGGRRHGPHPGGGPPRRGSPQLRLAPNFVTLLPVVIFIYLRTYYLTYQHTLQSNLPSSIPDKYHFNVHIMC